MQTQTNTNETPVHIKAQHNDEFRRFSLSNVTFTSLETMLRKLFNISESIKVRFLDDENDWVVISSDLELQHAVEISTSPIRIQITLTGKAPVVPTPEPTEAQFSFRGQGCGRGKGRGCCGMIPKEEMLALKTTRIAARISALETALLDPSLPSDRQQAITWQLEKLKLKLERIKTFKNTLTAVPQVENTEGEPRRHWRRGPGCGPCDREVNQLPYGDFPWRHCGRGRGGRCERGRLAGQEAATEGDHACGKKWSVPKESWAHFQECKENLKIARCSGDAEAVKIAFEAFVLAKQQKKETRYPKA